MDKVKDLLAKVTNSKALILAGAVGIMVLAGAAYMHSGKAADTETTRSYTIPEKQLAIDVKDYLGKYVLIEDEESEKIAETAVDAYDKIIDSNVSTITNEHIEALEDSIGLVLNDFLEDEDISNEDKLALSSGIAQIILNSLLEQIEGSKYSYDPEFEEQYMPIRLNKYIANAGVCSRREADTLIEAGAITVNGIVITELGHKVLPTDEVRFGDKILQREKPVYILLNKPKDYITTMYDEFQRQHVMQLIKGACKERVYPVGRLDRDTTGLLLFTNDGSMTKKLTHPRSEVRKLYHVTLNKNLSFADMQKIADGIELDDGKMAVDEIAYVGEHKDQVGVAIHSGKNRIIRRIFESLGYEVVKLDRTVYAGLTKKDLPRGSWRFLTPAEINILKMSIKQSER